MMGCGASASVVPDSSNETKGSAPHEESKASVESGGGAGTDAAAPGPAATDSTGEAAARNARLAKLSLVKAVKVNNVALARQLLADGADLNERGMWNNTPLITACMYNREELAVELLSRGADPSLFNERMCTALHYAAVENYVALVKALLKAGAPVNVPRGIVHSSMMDRSLLASPLIAAAANGYAEVARLLLDAGALLEDPVLLPAPRADSGVPEDARPSDALLSAAPPAMVEAARDAVLLESVHRECEYESPLLTAIRYRRRDTALLLIKRGADVNAPNMRGHTPFYRAIVAGDDKVGQTLITHGADIKQVPSDEEPLMVLLAKSGIYRTCREVLRRWRTDYDVDAVDPELGRSAVHHAVATEHIDVVRVLLHFGARADLKDKSGKSSADEAREQKNPDLADFLASLGSKPMDPSLQQGGDEDTDEEEDYYVSDFVAMGIKGK